MSRYRLNQNFLVYGFLISYIIGGWYIEMGMSDNLAIILSTTSLIVSIKGGFGVLEHYPYKNRY